MSGMKTEQGLFDAAVESARIFNWVAAECAVTGGLVGALAQFSTHAEIMHRMRFHPSKAEAVQMLLGVLVDIGLVERSVSGGQVVYQAKTDAVQRRRNLEGGLRRYQPEHALLAPWYGDQHTDLIRSSNKQLLGEDLSFFRSPLVKIRFDRTFLDAWRTNLLNPLYEFGRLIAIKELAEHGRRFLDLASGLGYGAQRLAEYSPQGCEIVCVDKSADMLTEARLLLYPGAQVQFIHWDLNAGLPPLPPAPFDGVLFNGAFHFIKDKRACLRELHRRLRPDGLLVIGHCFSRSAFPDEAMHELYFSLIEDACWPITFEELRTCVADAGFTEVRQYHRGSHSYLLAKRLPGAEFDSPPAKTS